MYFFFVSFDWKFNWNECQLIYQLRYQVYTLSESCNTSSDEIHSHNKVMSKMILQRRNKLYFNNDYVNKLDVNIKPKFQFL